MKALKNTFYFKDKEMGLLFLKFFNSQLVESLMRKGVHSVIDIFFKKKKKQRSYGYIKGEVWKRFWTLLE